MHRLGNNKGGMGSNL